MFSYVCSICACLDLLVSSSSWGLGGAAVCGCGTPWAFLLPFFRKIVGKSNFSKQFRKLINRYKRIGYSLDIMRQIACVVVNPIIVDGYASLFNCTMAVRASDSMTAYS